MRQLGCAAAIGLVVFTGCSSEENFSAEEFVGSINDQGVELRLGEALVTDEEGKELYAVELEPVPGTGAPAKGEHDHAAGSLSAYDDTAGADGELASCESAADLLCYRVANIVVVLEGGGLAAQQLGVAIQRLASEQ